MELFSALEKDELFQLESATLSMVESYYLQTKNRDYLGYEKKNLQGILYVNKNLVEKDQITLHIGATRMAPFQASGCFKCTFRATAPPKDCPNR